MSDSKEHVSGLSVYKRLLRVTRKYALIFFLGMVLTALVSVIDAGFAYYIKPIIDQGFIHRSRSFVHALPYFLLGAFILRSFSNFGSFYFITYVARSVVMRMRQMIFAQLMRLPATFYDQHTSGELIATILYNVDQVAQASADALLTLLREGALLIAMLFVMLSINWQISAAILVVAPIMLVLIKLCSKRLRRLSHHVQSSIGDVTQISEDGVQGYKVIRMVGAQGAEIERFEKATLLNRSRELKIIVTNSLNSSFVQILIALPAIGFLGVATSGVMPITAGGFAAIVTALFALLRPIRQLSRLNPVIQKGLAGASSVFELLDEAGELDTGSKVIDVADQVTVSYRHVSFSYARSDKPVVNDVSFTAKPGQMTALVGKSGGGKTSLVSLLPRFYDPQAGEICINDTPVSDLTLENLRQHISLVSQDTILFASAIRENILFGLHDVSEADFQAATKAAHIDEFVNELPARFDTLVGQNGVMLSGGQRQRIAIARAILKNAPILILDEATSALDTETEKLIQDAVESLVSTRTTLVIAHRLSTIEKADQILVVDQGRIVESGDHQSLLAQDGTYARLHKMQFKV